MLGKVYAAGGEPCCAECITPVFDATWSPRASSNFADKTPDDRKVVDTVHLITPSNRANIWCRVFHLCLCELVCLCCNCVMHVSVSLWIDCCANNTHVGCSVNEMTIYFYCLLWQTL